MHIPKHTDVNKNRSLDTYSLFSLCTVVFLQPAASWTADVIFLQDLVTHDLTSTSASETAPLHLFPGLQCFKNMKQWRKEF